MAIGLIALVTTSAASADPVQITRGAIVFDFEGHYFFMGGTDFEVSSQLPDSGFIPATFDGFCFPCRIGVDIVDLGFTTPGEVFVGTGPATVSGQTYSELFYRAQWSVDAVGELFPAPNPGPAVQVSQPFTLTGHLGAFLDPDFTTLAFAATLRGQGRARALYHYDADSDAYVIEEGNFGYHFEEAAPVPEPTTLLLFGTGAAALAWRRRRSRSKRENRC
jgi:hypothetical protein